jgi:hypothetical protein
MSVNGASVAPQLAERPEPESRQYLLDGDLLDSPVVIAEKEIHRRAPAESRVRVSALARRRSTLSERLTALDRSRRTVASHEAGELLHPQPPEPEDAALKRAPEPHQTAGYGGG